MIGVGQCLSLGAPSGLDGTLEGGFSDVALVGRQGEEHRVRGRLLRV